MLLTDRKRWPKKLGQTWSRPIFNLVRSPRFFPTGSEKSSPSSPPEAARLVAASTASSFFDVFKMFRQKKRAERNFVTSFQSIVFWKSIFCFLFFVGTFSGADFGFFNVVLAAVRFFFCVLFMGLPGRFAAPRGALRAPWEMWEFVVHSFYSFSFSSFSFFRLGYGYAHLGYEFKFWKFKLWKFKFWKFKLWKFNFWQFKLS